MAEIGKMLLRFFDKGPAENGLYFFTGGIFTNKIWWGPECVRSFRYNDN